MEKRVHYKGKRLPYLLIAPQMTVLVVFFFWPAAQGVVQAFFLSDPFLNRMIFVGLENFAILFSSPEYHTTILNTLVFSAASTVLSMGAALILALCVNRSVRRLSALRSLIIWPYAVAPAIAGMLWLFMFHPAFGAVAALLADTGIGWDPLLNGRDAMLLVVGAAAWKQVSYNFVFFLAGLQAIPATLLEAAAIDGAGPFRRGCHIVLPLLSPTTFFLLVMNGIYAFFDTFGIIDATTEGGPGGATRTLIYKVYKDGFQGQDIGSAAAQSIILMLIVVAFTVLQFRLIDRRIAYE
jgi:sn-glycerol 3-phosphate transport system permease protein